MLKHMFLHTNVKHTFICTYTRFYNTYVCMNVYSILHILFFAESLMVANVLSRICVVSQFFPALLLYATDLLLVHYYCIQYCIQFSILMYLKFMLRHVTFFIL